MPIVGQNNSININQEAPNLNRLALALPSSTRNISPTEIQAENETQREELHKTRTDEPSRLEEIAKDLRYAKLSTNAMWITTLLSWINPNSPSRTFELANPDKSKRAGIIGMAQDFFLRTRMMAQLTQHADPGSKKLIGDDIPMCNLHNPGATKTGMKAYAYYAFAALPLWFIQNFLVTGKHYISKLPNALMRAYHRVKALDANMFWNKRRISGGSTKYVNSELISMCSPDSEAFKKYKEATAPVKTMMSQWSILLKAYTHRQLTKYLPSTLMHFIETKLGFNLHNLREANRKVTAEAQGEDNPFAALGKVALANIKNNWNALTTGKHKSIITGEIQDIKEEDSKTPNWYIKSKLLANFLNPFVGLGAYVINAASMATGVIGELIKDKSTTMLSLSQNLLDSANGAMSVVYMLGEVFGHAAAAMKGYQNGEIKTQNLLTLGIGTLGMGWRIVKGAVAALAIPGMLFKPLGNFCKKILHSRVDNILDPLFLLFFSVNRKVNLTNSYNAEANNASHAERKAAEKYTKASHILSLPLRILTHDPDVSYNHPEALARAEALAAT